MEIVLLEDVKSLGKKGDVVKVSDGYARNFILPKKLGVEATPKNLNELRLQKANAARIAAQQLSDAKDLAAKLADAVEDMAADASVTVRIKAGDNGKAFGSVSGKEIARAAEEQLGLDLDKKKLVLPEPLKTLGVHEVAVKLHRDVTAKLTVKVEAE